MLSSNTNGQYLYPKLLLVLWVVLSFILFFREDLNQQLFIWINNKLYHPLAWQFITILGDAIVLIIVLLPICLRSEKFRLIVFWGGIICWLLIRISKLSFAELRPLSILPAHDVYVSGIKLYQYSFPSGHSASIAAAVFAAIRTFGLKRVYALPLLILVFIVALSRITVGAHWPVDILFGVLFGYVSILISEKICLMFAWATNKFFSLTSAILFIVVGLYALWHQTGYEISNVLMFAWLLVSLVAIFVPNKILDRFGNDHFQVKTYLIFLAFIWIFVVFESILGWKDILLEWKKISLWQLLGLLILTALSYWVRAFRLQVHYCILMKGKLREAYWISSWHNLLNNLLPFRIGELAYPALLKKNFGISLVSSLTTLLTFRILDLYAIGLFGIAVFGYYKLLLFNFIFIVILYFTAPLIIWLMAIYLKKLNKFSTFLNKFTHGELTARTMFYSCNLSILNWFLKLLAFSILMKALSDLDLTSALIGSIGGELSSVAPFHGVMGLGTYEAGVSIALSLMGVKFDSALLAAINLHLFVLLSSVFSVLIAFLVRKKNNDN